MTLKKGDLLVHPQTLELCRVHSSGPTYTVLGHPPGGWRERTEALSAAIVVPPDRAQQVEHLLGWGRLLPIEEDVALEAVSTILTDHNRAVGLLRATSHPVVYLLVAETAIDPVLCEYARERYHQEGGPEIPPSLRETPAPWPLRNGDVVLTRRGLGRVVSVSRRSALLMPGSGSPTSWVWSELGDLLPAGYFADALLIPEDQIEAVLEVLSFFEEPG